MNTTISKKTLKTMDKSIKNLKKGKVSKPVDVKYPKVTISTKELIKSFEMFDKYNLALTNIRIDCIQIDTGKKVKLDLKEMLEWFSKQK